ncbi:sulfate transporter [Mycobacterium branderi]|uniref:Anti-sigma factor antagonist n=2 Tax=Mycobacterium branderi TaxID=43348 RepID=A0A7I7W1A1_9MYCO|nr:STAS domain-containing protein [Mycobacterium branderi]MCV7233094.1 STAS domain-containing protein [Mycobacterium branderi]ORA41190.1 sulfate transporter [Mycobacterium branderi]BBZ10203.1 sulfate transporter [Mycobacterium branderi]
MSTTAGFAATAFPSQPWESHTARFTAHRGATAAVVSASGELDASNANQLADYVVRCAASTKSLVVDLSGVEFFGTAGFSALHTINVRCAGADVRWAVVPSHAVSRLLRICDPDKTLPIAESVTEGLADNEEPRRLLQLIAQSR